MSLATRCRRERRGRRRSATRASKPAIGTPIGPAPDSPADASTTPTCHVRPQRHGLSSEIAVGRGREPRREVAVDQRNDDLRFRIAEADVELDDLGTVAGQHQPGVEKAAVLRAFARACPRYTGSTISRMMRACIGLIDQRARRERAHAAGVRPSIAVEDALVILRRHQRLRARAVAEREE